MRRLIHLMIVAAAVGATSVAVVVLWSLTVVKAAASCDLANCTGPAPSVYCGSIWVHDWDGNFYCRPQLHIRREALGIAGVVGTGVAVFAGVGAVVLSWSYRRTGRLSPGL